MHLHILGICGTFMGSLAQLAQAMGHKVTGSDAGVYPPMSDQLAQAGIEVIEGFDPSQLDPAPDCVVIGNAMSRGNPAVEYVLDRGIPYVSGPDWLGRHLLSQKWVLAVAGTHGKTTTASMIAWILEYAGMNPSYLIGGVPQNFQHSARLTDSNFFVIEADEYDTAFFDKRSKFVHYHPRTLVLNNLEFDHADIFPDLAAIERQFHHLVRIVPSTGHIVYPAQEKALQRVIDQGCWSATHTIGDQGGWTINLLKADGSEFEIQSENIEQPVKVDWQLSGQHNVNNALAAIVACRSVGVEPHTAAEALGKFESVKRRMELKADKNEIRIYDDFAHHPTAIELTLTGAANKQAREAEEGKNRQRLIAVLEPRSNTMKLGNHKAELAASVAKADLAFWYQPAGLEWSLNDVIQDQKQKVFGDFETLLAALAGEIKAGDDVIIMSNGSFNGLHQKLIDRLALA